MSFEKSGIYGREVLCLANPELRGVVDALRALLLDRGYDLWDIVDERNADNYTSI